MKASLRDFIEKAFEFLPHHRKKAGERKQSLHLDQLLDESRTLGNIPHSTLDFILMTYRYWNFFSKFQASFSDKKIKPTELADLWALGFSALLTRDQTPAELLVNDCVELAKKRFGPHTGGVTNAFLRRVAREKTALIAEISQNPEILLGPVLLERWKKEPGLCRSMGKKLLLRPESGVECFDERGTFLRLPKTDFLERVNSERLQSINLGSWKFLEWVISEINTDSKNLNILDACAAPGGKTLGLWTLLNGKGIESHFVATDSKFPRLDTLSKNIGRWNLGSHIKTELVDWMAPEINVNELKGFAPTLVMADLPCTGLGTLHSRPDLLLEDLEQRSKDLIPIQKKILGSLITHFKDSNALLFVSVCSVDPYEIGRISNILSSTPHFSSLSDGDDAEGIQGWKIKL